MEGTNSCLVMECKEMIEEASLGKVYGKGKWTRCWEEHCSGVEEGLGEEGKRGTEVEWKEAAVRVEEL